MTVRLISNRDLWNWHIAEGRVEAVQAWVRANGIDPNDVPVDPPLTIESSGGGVPVIRYTALLRNENGRPYPDPDTGDAAAEERTVPLVVEPPAEWPVDMAPEPA